MKDNQPNLTTKGCGEEFEDRMQGYFYRCGFEGALCPSCKEKIEIKKPIEVAIEGDNQPLSFKDVLTAEEILLKALGSTSGKLGILMPSLTWSKFKDEQFIPLSRINSIQAKAEKELKEFKKHYFTNKPFIYDREAIIATCKEAKGEK